MRADLVTGKPAWSKRHCGRCASGASCSSPVGEIHRWCTKSHLSDREVISIDVMYVWSMLPIVHPGVAPLIRAARPLATLHHNSVLSASIARGGLTAADGAPARGARQGGHGPATHNVLIGHDQAVHGLRCVSIHILARVPPDERASTAK